MKNKVIFLVAMLMMTSQIMMASALSAPSAPKAAQVVANKAQAASKIQAKFRGNKARISPEIKKLREEQAAKKAAANSKQTKDPSADGEGINFNDAVEKQVVSITTALTAKLANQVDYQISKPNATGDRTVNFNGQEIKISSDGTPWVKPRAKDKLKVSSEKDIIATRNNDGTVEIRDPNTNQILKIDVTNKTTELTTIINEKSSLGNKTTREVSELDASGKIKSTKIFDSKMKDIGSKEYSENGEFVTTKMNNKPTIIKNIPTGAKTTVNEQAGTASIQVGDQRVNVLSDGTVMLGKAVLVASPIVRETGMLYGKKALTIKSETSPTGEISIKISNNKGEHLSSIVIQADGKIVVNTIGNNQQVTNNLTVKVVDGKLQVTQPSTISGMKPTVIEISQTGSRIKTEHLATNSTATTINNGPRIITENLSAGVETSQIESKSGQSITVQQNGLRLTIEGKAGRSRIIEGEHYLNALKKARTSAEYDTIIDNMTLDIVGAKNWVSGNVAGKEILHTAAYQKFKDQLKEELHKNMPTEPVAETAFTKRMWQNIVSIFDRPLAGQAAKATKAALKESRDASNKEALTEALQERSLENTYTAPTRSNQKNTAAKEQLRIEQGTQQFEANGITTRINAHSEAVRNTSVAGTVDFSGDNYAIHPEGGKHQWNINPITGALSSGTISSITFHNRSRAKQLIDVNPETGATTTITMRSDGVTPLSKSVHGLDGSVQFYAANGKGKFSELPTSEITTNEFGDISVANHSYNAKGQRTATRTRTLQSDGKIIDSNYSAVDNF